MTTKFKKSFSPMLICWNDIKIHLGFEDSYFVPPPNNGLFVKFFMGWDTVSKLRPVGVFVNFRNMSPSVSLTWGLWTQGNVKAAHCVMYV